MSKSFHKGQKVHWTWADDKAHGTVQDKFERRVQRTIKGTKVVRNGSKENPAYLLEQEDGTKLLKLAKELTAD
jgi:hypothetical protein